MAGLAQKSCVPCQGGAHPLRGQAVEELKAQLDGWQVVVEHHLSKSFNFPDFAEALLFVNRLGQLAEAEGHHPDVFLSWGRVRVDIWTHAIDGLTESDFILAAKTDTL